MVLHTPCNLCRAGLCPSTTARDCSLYETLAWSQLGVDNRRTSGRVFLKDIFLQTNSPTPELCFVLAHGSCTPRVIDMQQYDLWWRLFVYFKWSTEDKNIIALGRVCWNINQMMDLGFLCSADCVLIQLLLPFVIKKYGPPPFLLTIFSFVIVKCLYVSYKNCLHGRT